MSDNLSFLAGRKGITAGLFEKIGEAANETGTPSKEKLAQLADEFLVGKATTYGSTTFYDFLKPENKNKKVYVCNGTACLCAGSQDGLKKELEKHVNANEIGHMTCLGRCHENKAFNYAGHNYSGLTSAEIKELFNAPFIQNDRYKVGHSGTSVLTAKSQKPTALLKDLEEVLLNRTPEEVLEEIKNSKLRGRGGAGFPMAFKLESAKNTPAKTRFIVCNADEGDPGAYTDRYLLEERPHTLLLGMLLAGYAMNAQWGVLYIRAEYPESVQIIEKTIQWLRDSNGLGDSIFGSEFSFDFKVIKAQGAYICGEETALLSSIEGQRPEVRIRPPYPTQQGLFNLPTVVNNVETLAALPFILKNGGEKYAKLGTSKSTGTKLVSLDGFFKKPGVYEVEMGTPLSTVIYDLGGGFKTPVKALHIGGPLGGLVPISKIDQLTVDFESFTTEGFLLGHASVVSIPKDFPMISYLEHLFEFTAAESCGKCFPCRLGSVRGQELIRQAIDQKQAIDPELFDDLLDALEQGSLCALGGGLPLPIKNALTYFKDELNPYFETKAFVI